MQGQLGWFSLEEGCLQENLIDPPVHMRVIKETAGLLTVWGGGTSINRHKLKKERLKYLGSATSCPERTVLQDFQDQSRQHLIWIPAWDQTRNLLRSLPASVILWHEYNFMLFISVSNRVKAWLDYSSCASSWAEGADEVGGFLGKLLRELRPICAPTAPCCCWVSCQIL